MKFPYTVQTINGPVTFRQVGEAITEVLFLNENEPTFNELKSAFAQKNHNVRFAGNGEIEDWIYVYAPDSDIPGNGGHPIFHGTYKDAVSFFKKLETKRN